MSNITTACEHCIFATKTNKVQTGCLQNRLDIYLDRGQARLEDKVYIIDDYCNTCRNVYWKENKKHKTTQELVAAAQREEKVSYDVIANIDGVEMSVVDDMIEALNSDYPPHTIVLATTLNEETVNLWDKYQYYGNIKLCLDISQDIFQRYISHVGLSISHYLLFLTPGIDFSIDMCKYNYAANIELNPYIYINDPSYFLVLKNVYSRHMRDENPFESIKNTYKERYVSVS